MNKTIKEQVLEEYIDVYGNDFKDVREFEKEDMEAIVENTLAKVLKCSCCGKKNLQKGFYSLECSDCYLKGMEKEGFISLAKVEDEIEKIFVEEEGDSTHDLQLKANLHSENQMTEEEIKIRRWVIFAKFGMNEVPYILDTTNLDVSEDEICLCIQEQIYGESNEL